MQPFDLQEIQFVSPKGDLEPYRGKLSEDGFAKLQEILLARAIISTPIPKQLA